MIYVIWLDLDSDPCRGGGGAASSMILCHMYIVFIILCLDWMLHNPLLPLAGRLATIK